MKLVDEKKEPFKNTGYVICEKSQNKVSSEIFNKEDKIITLDYVNIPKDSKKSKKGTNKNKTLIAESFILEADQDLTESDLNGFNFISEERE